jgi:malate:Na+ symporter
VLLVRNPVSVEGWGATNRSPRAAFIVASPVTAANQHVAGSVASPGRNSPMLPGQLEESSRHWGDLAASLFVPALLVAVSLTYIDIADVLAAVSSPLFMALTVATVLVATLTSGLLGWLVKFHFVEVAITPGLVMADTGGSGDVSVLSAANRMHLMPFAALTTRLGGALVLFVTSLIAPALS